MGFNFVGWIVISVIVVLLGLIVAMVGITLKSLTKQGDERKKMIVSKAMSTSFVFTVILIVFEAFRAASESVDGSTSSFILLVAIAIVFLVSLTYFKKKYGG